MNADVCFVTVIDDCDNVYLTVGTIGFSKTWKISCYFVVAQERETLIYRKVFFAFHVSILHEANL